ncbi:MAG: hypothetical protein JW838_15775 [Spirochaetes bacterium]|nr:hypothetical protein [Spirochaetota bacterium]
MKKEDNADSGRVLPFRARGIVMEREEEAERERAVAESFEAFREKSSSCFETLGEEVTEFLFRRIFRVVMSRRQVPRGTWLADRMVEELDRRRIGLDYRGYWSLPMLTGQIWSFLSMRFPDPPESEEALREEVRRAVWPFVAKAPGGAARLDAVAGALMDYFCAPREYYSGVLAEEAVEERCPGAMSGDDAIDCIDLVYRLLGSRGRIRVWW